MRNADVSHLRMQRSVHQVPFRHSPATDPRPHGQIRKRTQSPSRAPIVFGQGGSQLARIALTGKAASPPIFQVMSILGKAETLARLRAAEAALERV